MTGLTERTLADLLVGEVCHCGPPPGHDRGFPECATARRAARIVLDAIARDEAVVRDDETAASAPDDDRVADVVQVALASDLVYTVRLVNVRNSIHRWTVHRPDCGHIRGKRTKPIDALPFDPADWRIKAAVGSLRPCSGCKPTIPSGPVSPSSS